MTVYQEKIPFIEILKSLVSLIATLAGLAVIGIGLKYAIQIFDIIFAIIQSPAALMEPVKEMGMSLGGDVFDIKLEDRSIPLANLMGLAVYCGGLLLCAWLTLALMQAGAKIVSMTAGDRGAVKKILQSAFGKKMKPKGDQG